MCEADVGGHVIETFLGQSEGGLKKFGNFDPFPQAKPHGYGPGYRTGSARPSAPMPGAVCVCIHILSNLTRAAHAVP